MFFILRQKKIFLPQNIFSHFLVLFFILSAKKIFIASKKF